jgi:hypothetical protein
VIFLAERVARSSACEQKITQIKRIIAKKKVERKKRRKMVMNEI